MSKFERPRGWENSTNQRLGEKWFRMAATEEIKSAYIVNAELTEAGAKIINSDPNTTDEQRAGLQQVVYEAQQDRDTVLNHFSPPAPEPSTARSDVISSLTRQASGQQGDDKEATMRRVDAVKGMDSGLSKGEIEDRLYR